MSFTKQQIEENNERLRIESLALGALSPEERRRHMDAKRAGNPLTANVPAPSFSGCPGMEMKERPIRKPRAMNVTETRYSLVLDEMKRRGEIVRWVYEAVKLKWGDGMYYTADFWVVRPGNLKRLLVEVKNAHIWNDDRTRFLGCRAEWKDEYDFELRQWKKKQWILLY